MKLHVISRNQKHHTYGRNEQHYKGRLKPSLWPYLPHFPQWCRLRVALGKIRIPLPHTHNMWLSRAVPDWHVILALPIDVPSFLQHILLLYTLYNMAQTWAASTRTQALVHDRNNQIKPSKGFILYTNHFKYPRNPQSLIDEHKF